MIETPEDASRRTTPKSTWISVSVRIAEGSSRMSTFALPTSALAMETCCCSAIDSSLTATVAYPAGSPMSSSSSTTRAFCAARATLPRGGVVPHAGVLRVPARLARAGGLPAGEDALGDGQVGEQLGFLVDGRYPEGAGVG